MNTTIEDVKQYFDQFGKVSRLCVRQLKVLWDSMVMEESDKSSEAACYGGFTMGN